MSKICFIIVIGKIVTMTFSVCNVKLEGTKMVFRSRNWDRQHNGHKTVISLDIILTINTILSF